MENCAAHCPFLNRHDRRCSKHFSLDRLNSTFDHCFGSYKACSVYMELLVERQVRRATGEIVSPNVRQRQMPTVNAYGQPLVQVSLPSRSAAASANRYVQSAA